MRPRVAAFTDVYLPTVTGVTYAVRSWREAYRDRGGRMPVVYPDGEYDSGPGEHPVDSVPFPFYEGFRVGVPDVPSGVRAADVVHAHTPFTLGLAGLALARRRDRPLVASYHTPTGEYADYLDPAGLVETADPTGLLDGLGDALSGLTDGLDAGVDLGPLDPRRLADTAVAEAADRYERVFYERADAVVVPSASARDRLAGRVSLPRRVEVIGNGVDVERFRPVDAADFRARHDLPAADEGVLVGYTGRHGHEKDLDVLVDAAPDLGGAAGADRSTSAGAGAEDGNVTVVFGGDGPARSDLEARAREVDADVRFLGFLDRDEMPAFYSALNVFVLPSPVETQGIVALEANACGTPVVGADAGALTDTVEAGETGHRFAPGDPGALAATVRETLAERERLRERCLGRREAVSVGRAVDRLESLYRDLS